MEKDRVPHNFMIRVKAIYDTLKSVEKRAVDTILENPQLVARVSVVEMAKVALCSDATLIRLARKLGFNGYPELKKAILEEDDESTVYDSIDKNDDPVTIVDKVFLAATQALEDTRAMIDKEQYLKALELIVSSNRLLFVGVGDAFIVAYSAFLKFSRIGYDAVSTKDYDIQLIEASKLTGNDTLIIISHSGQTSSIYEVAKLAREKGARIVTITNYPLSHIAKISDCTLLTAAFTPNVNNEIMAKRIPELAVIETLYINTLLQSDSIHQEILKQSNNVLKRNKL